MQVFNINLLINFLFLRYRVTYMRMPVPWIYEKWCRYRLLVRSAIVAGCVSDDLIFSKADKFVLIHIERIIYLFCIS